MAAGPHAHCLPGVDANGFSDLLFYAMLGVVLGGRIGYMLFYALGDFLHNPLLLFKVWDGGMSFHGGLLGVLGACWWWSRKHKLHFFDTMDFMAPLVPLGLASAASATSSAPSCGQHRRDLGRGVPVRPAGPAEPARPRDAAGAVRHRRIEPVRPPSVAAV